MASVVEEFKECLSQSGTVVAVCGKHHAWEHAMRSLLPDLPGAELSMGQSTLRMPNGSRAVWVATSDSTRLRGLRVLRHFSAESLVDATHPSPRAKA